jgi:hypothetical protein
MITSSEIPAALAHVAGAAKSRLLMVAPHVDDVVLDFIRRGATPGVEVQVRHHARVKAIVADGDMALILSGSLTPVSTSIGFVAEVDGGMPNTEAGLLVDDPAAVGALLRAVVPGA